MEVETGVSYNKLSDGCCEAVKHCDGENVQHKPAALSLTDGNSTMPSSALVMVPQRIT